MAASSLPDTHRSPFFCGADLPPGGCDAYARTSESRFLCRGSPPESDGPLIEQYATAILNAQEAQRQVDKYGLVHGLKMSPWATSLEKMQKMIVALSLRLRLSPQSRHERKAKSLQGPPANSPNRPWHDDE